MARNWKMAKIGTNYKQIVKIMCWILILVVKGQLKHYYIFESFISTKLQMLDWGIDLSIT